MNRVQRQTAQHVREGKSTGGQGEELEGERGCPVGARFAGSREHRGDLGVWERRWCWRRVPFLGSAAEIASPAGLSSL